MPQKPDHTAVVGSQADGRPLSIYFVAGEASGDRHAAALLYELKKQNPAVDAYGAGGPQLRAAGQLQCLDLAAHAVVGLTDVLRNYFKFRSFFKLVERDMLDRKPDAIVLVDYPGFNLRLAARIRKKLPDTKIIYYISPQVWAWKKGRTKLMRRVVDLLLVIFEFEKRWFEENEPELPVRWVGHPLMDRWQGPPDDDVSGGHVRQIILMPGSREKEIKRHLPVLLDVAKRCTCFLPDVKYILLAPDEQARRTAEEIIEKAKLGALAVETLTGYQLTHLARSDLAMVASGTATVECCLANVPMFVIYRVHPLTFLAGKMLVKLPYLSMVNILAGEKVVPEFLQEKVNADLITEAVRRYASDSRWQEMMRERLKKVAALLGEKGAGERAARAILDLLGRV